MTASARHGPRSDQPCYVSIAYTHEPTDPRVRRHCESMARHGWRVFQLGIAADGERSVGRLSGVQLVRWRRGRYRGRSLYRYALAYLGFLLWAHRLVRRLARTRRVRVVHVNNLPNFAVLAAGPGRRRGAGVILDIHDPVPELFLSKFGSRPGAKLGSRLLRLEERVAARRADLVLCVHGLHREVTASHGVGPEKLRVVVNAPDGQLFPLLSPRAAGSLVVYHGTVAARMGLDVVLEGLALARRRGRQIRLAIWGDGDAVESLRRARDRLGLADAVEVDGRRFRLEDLIPRLRRAGVGFVPVARDVFTDLMLPTKLLEYVRLGIPVIVAWTPTIAHHFPEDTVRFVREFSAAGVAEALEWMLADPERARQQAARAQRLPIARAWQESEAEFISMVQEVGRVENSP